MSSSESQARQLRLLVAIASYGQKNLELLKKIIQRYRSMPMKIDVVVVSEAPKDLGPGVKVVVGLPAKNPWSLPFAHKAIFAREVENYDLFVYSEDDIQYTEKNIEAFLCATRELAPDEIAGFLLYEQDRTGTKWLTSIYGHWHWKPESVRRQGSYTVAEFSNQHSASYLLTQAQLRRAIASGGFLREPYEHHGLYDLLCTAATDPYTSCGFRKVICISAVEEFLIHHTPDRYIDLSCVSLEFLKEEIQVLLEIGEGRRPAQTLFQMEPRFWHFWWQKAYYEKPSEGVLDLVPREAKEVLSVGCGWGATETKLQQRGAKVTVLPLDSLMGATASRRGMSVVEGTWEECLSRLNGRSFDCVLMTDLLHLQPAPARTLGQCARLVGKNGTMVLAGPNFDRVPWWLKRVAGIGEFRKLRRFEEAGISVCGPRTLRKPLKKAGFQVSHVTWLNHAFGEGLLRGRRIPLGGATGRDWMLQARRCT
jgi:2-polyprenyl-3-methyl-5-hydroxy-6-metoxy-1,4-benzoquinol methylase